MADVLEEALDVGFHHPLRPFIGDDLRDSAQRIMRTATRTEAIRAVSKGYFWYYRSKLPKE